MAPGELGQEKSSELRQVVIPMLGKFKGEHGERWHLLLIAEETASGFKPQTWTDRVASLLCLEGKKEGAVICEEDGSMIPFTKIEDEFHAQLLKIQESHPHLIGPLGVDQASLDLQNRWTSIEKKQGVLSSFRCPLVIERQEANPNPNHCVTLFDFDWGWIPFVVSSGDQKFTLLTQGYKPVETSDWLLFQITFGSRVETYYPFT
eukprot:2411924-Ditylum_brightwellii.AAC.1